jgi:hypothetical protein
MLESTELLAAVLVTDAAAACEIDPDGSPPGATIRVLFDEPFLAFDNGTGTYQNTKPVAYALASDVASAVPAVTVFRINGTSYVANRIEPVEGATWRMLVLNR